MSVGIERAFWKNSSLDRDASWVVNEVGPRYRALDGRAHRRLLVNTVVNDCVRRL